MKLGNRQFLAHLLALLGTGVFWLAVDGGISLLLKGFISSCVLLHGAATALLSYVVIFFRQQRVKVDFGLTMLFRPIAPQSFLDDMSSEFTNQRNP